MQLFKDHELTQPLNDVDVGESWFLESRTAEFWIYNDDPFPLSEITLKSSTPNVTFKHPTTLQPRERAPASATWQPNSLKDLKGELTLDANVTLSCHFEMPYSDTFKETDDTPQPDCEILKELETVPCVVTYAPNKRMVDCKCNKKMAYHEYAEMINSLIKQRNESKKS